ncbi:MAG TPA: lysine/arginine/ornithine ABC transporter substrate-binding protein [Azospirillaceae bacterium]|nr:lysine/arginine/ornithine ABC transporter substrate-binding protein [Azospirillaceae bacterium]
MKKVLLAIAGAAAILAGAATDALAQQRTVRVATEGAYRPWNFTDASGKLVGFEIDLANDLCRRMNAKCEIIAQDWDGIIPALQQGRYDVIMAGMSVTEKRKEVIDFAGPYATDATVFSALKSSPLVKTPTGERLDMQEISAEEKKTIDGIAQQLKGKTVGVQVSTIQQAMMEQLFPGVTIRTYDTGDNAALDLVAGRVDALLMDRSAVNAIIQAEGGQGKDIQIFGPAFARGVLGAGVGVGLRKNDADLKKAFDKAIADATADGTITRLSTQWFGYDLAIRN